MDKKTVGHLISWLRRGTTRSPERKKCLDGAKTLYVDQGKVRAKYQCALCRNWFPKRMIEVDHINEVGPYKGDWDDYIKRMYCPASNLQALCSSCHSKKTATYNARLHFSRKTDLDWL